MLLHPRLPPLIRSTPLAENLALIFSEESDQEAELRKSLGLYTNQIEIQQHLDIEMNNSTPQPLGEPVIHTSSHASSYLEITSPVTRQELVSALQPQPKEKEKAISSPEPTSVEAQADKEQLILYQSSVVEAPKLPISQSSPKAHQPGPSNSVPTIPRRGVPFVGDEDEEMPAINLDSDSDPE